MVVMILTALIVGIFALFARNQYKRAMDTVSSTGIKSNGHMRGYWVFVGITIAILASIAGLRYYIGTDYGGYYNGFQGLGDSLAGRLREWDEPILAIIAKILLIFTDDGAYYIFILAAITIFLILFTMARYTDDYFFAVMLYIFSSCWSGCFNGVRQFLAVAIVFAGHRLIYKRKFIPFCFIVFLATSTHVTALIMLPMYFLITEKLDIKKILFILATGVVLIYSYDILFNLVGILKDSETGGADTQYAQSEIHPLRVAIAFAPVALYILLRLQNVQFTGEENFYMGFVFVRFAFVFGTLNSAYLNRASMYFSPFIPLAMCFLLRKFEPKQQALMKILVMLLYAYVWYTIDASSIDQWDWVFERENDKYVEGFGDSDQLIMYS